MKISKTKTLLSKLDYLKKVPLFRDLNEKQIKSIIASMHIEQIEKEQFIIHEGDAENNLYILLSSKMKISKSLVLPKWIQAAQKQEKSLIRLSEKHHPFFGEMAMFDDEPERSASIKAIQSCLMAFITKKDLLKILKSDPEIGMIIYRNIASELVIRLKKANKDILKLTTAFTLALEG